MHQTVFACCLYMYAYHGDGSLFAWLDKPYLTAAAEPSLLTADGPLLILS